MKFPPSTAPLPTFSAVAFLCAGLALACISPTPAAAEIPGANALGDLIGEQFDTNDDGEIDTNEWNAGVANGFETLDADGNSDIEAAEIEELGAPIREQFGDLGGALVVALVRAVVLTLDTDKNQIVSRAEYDRETKGFLKRIDADGNGSVSQTELSSLPAKLLASGK